MSNSVEAFRPKLKKGRVIPRGPTFIFETDDPFDQIEFPMAVADFVLLCSGQFTVREIIEKIYIKQESVPFRAVFKAIHLLHSRGFFENSEELEDESWLSYQQMALFKGYFEFKVERRLSMRALSPIVFYGLCMFVLVCSIGGLIYVPDNLVSALQLFLEPGYGRAFLELFIVHSLFLTLRSLFKGAEILSLTGRLSAPSLRIAPWGIYVCVKDEVTELYRNKLFATLYHLSQCSGGFLLLPLVAWAAPSYLNICALSAILIAVWEVNPFRLTEAYKLIRCLMIPAEIDPIFYFESEFAQNNRDFNRICSLWGLVWIVGCVATLHDIALTHGHVVIAEISRTFFKPTPALIFGALWLFSLYFVVHALIETIKILMIHPLLLKMASLRKKFSSYRQAKGSMDVVSMIKDLPLFTHFSETLIEKLVKESQLVEYSKNSYVIVEGEPSLYLYILLSGLVVVERHQAVGFIHPITIFGERALLDDLPREASVCAREKSICLKIPQALIKKIAQESQVVRELEHFMNSIMIDQFFASAPLGRKMPREGIEFLSSRGILQFKGAGETIFQQGDPGDSFYMVIRGSVDVSVADVAIKSIGQGGFFGEISLIANIPRTATVKAAVPAVLFKVTSQAFWEVLVRHIEMAMFIESVGEQRLHEDLQVMRRQTKAS